MIDITPAEFNKAIGDLNKSIGNLKHFIQDEVKDLRMELHVLDAKVENLDTKIDTKFAELHSEIEDLALITAKGFEDLERRLDVTERIEKLEREFAQIKQALRV
jgi:chromosome segregation ATPase